MRETDNPRERVRAMDAQLEEIEREGWPASRHAEVAAIQRAISQEAEFQGYRLITEFGQLWERIKQGEACDKDLRSLMCFVHTLRILADSQEEMYRELGHPPRSLGYVSIADLPVALNALETVEAEYWRLPSDLRHLVDADMRPPRPAT